MVEDVLFCFREYWIVCQLKKCVGTDGETFGECREEWVGSGFGRQSSVFEDDALGSGLNLVVRRDWYLGDREASTGRRWTAYTILWPEPGTFP
jgi:hypothetical protein